MFSIFFEKYFKHFPNNFREGEIAETFSKIRSDMKDKPIVGLPDLLAAREDALIVEKVSSKKSRAHTQTSLNKVEY